MANKKTEEAVEETAAEVKAEETVETEAPAKEAAAEEKKPAAKAKKPARSRAKKTKAQDADGSQDKRNKRTERIGIVFSDKMTDTVVVRVDRLVKHPMYRKYVKKRKKFMAHNGLGAVEGDRVKIVETRPLSAKKRWRVVEIIQKAEK
ncbi:MAG TPA: 30S ribosomal protein S17 [Aridibacter sp.]|nr:30S ribosomal protein S17 [Aridibacter sp.]